MFVIDYAIVGKVSSSERNTIAINNCIEADEKLSLHLVDEKKYGGKCLLVSAESEDFKGIASAEWLLIDVPDELVESIAINGLLLMDMESKASVEFEGLTSLKDNSSLPNQNIKYVQA